MALLRSKGWIGSLQTLSTKFISKTIARAAKMSTTPFSPKDNAAEHGGPNPNQPQKAKAAKGSWEWRAFVHQRSAGCKFDAEFLRTLSHEFRSLLPAEKEVYVEAGRAAARASAAGLPAFHKDHSGKKKAKTAKTSKHRDDVSLLDSAHRDADVLSVLQYSRRDNFMAGFTSLRQSLSNKAKGPVEEVIEDVAQASADSSDQYFTAEELQQLSEFESNCAQAYVPSTLADAGHTDAAATFSQHGANVSRFCSLGWFPCLTQLCKDGDFATSCRLFDFGY